MVSSVEGEKLIQELTDFEQRVSDLGVVTSQQLFRISEISLKGAAKEWLELERNTNRVVSEAYRRAKHPNADEAAYAAYFRLARGLLTGAR